MDLIGPADYPIKVLIQEACKLFRTSRNEDIFKNCDLQMGSLNGEVIDAFRDAEGKPCTVWEYLKIFPQERFKLYLMTSERKIFFECCE